MKVDFVVRRRAVVHSATSADSQDRVATSEHARALSAVSDTEASRCRIPRVGGPALEEASEVALGADSTAVEGFTAAVAEGRTRSEYSQQLLWRSDIMHKTNTRFDKFQAVRRATTTVFGLLLMVAGCTPSSFAQKPDQRTFTSPDRASQELFVAVQSGNEPALMQILGGKKEVVSSDDEVQDKLDREKFAQKYVEMHRLIQELDGTTFLYIGAENWPFPVPLVSKSGTWYFDADDGVREILFRRVGENEIVAIGTCHELVMASKRQDPQPIDDDAVSQYARALVNIQQAGTSTAATNEQETADPFHGYYFRRLSGKRKETGDASVESGSIVFIAYPIEYRSSGVMTFVITHDDVVHEADLGPNTVKIASTISTWKPNSHWHVVY